LNFIHKQGRGDGIIYHRFTKIFADKKWNIELTHAIQSSRCRGRQERRENSRV
jgi:hypothetical protein